MIRSSREDGDKMTTSRVGTDDESQISKSKAENARAERVVAAGRRALAEATARRAATPQCAPSDEIGGRGGLEPTRYGDWEKKGLATDF
jgi:hypothetical protein